MAELGAAPVVARGGINGWDPDSSCHTGPFHEVRGSFLFWCK